jgi:hypothetical protein
MEYRDPQSLLSIDRLDVFLKKLYFDVVGGGRTRDAGFIVSLYRKHILHRTGGVEPPDCNNAEHHVRKSCIEDYEREALALYHSVSENGFRTDRTIALSDELLLVNGAHRLAVALSLGLRSIPVARSAHGGIWGADWFRRYFSSTEYLFLLEEYASFRLNSAPVLLWGIAEEFWGDLIVGLRQRGMRVAIVQVLDVHDNFDGFYRLIHELYGVEPQSNDDIRRKAIIHGSYSTKLAVLHVEPALSAGFEQDFYECLSEIKYEIRDMFNDRINKDLFLTLHMPDSEVEKQRMLRLLYSPSSLRFYRWFRFNDVSTDPALWQAIEGFKTALEQTGLPKNKVCVVGSAVLGVCGVRQPADIDFVVSSDLDSASYKEALITYGEYDLLLNGYSLKMRTGNVTTDEVINSSRYHFFFSGLKFADPFYVFLKKKLNGLEKDVVDQRLMKEAIRHRCGDKRSRFMRDELLWLEGVVRGVVS